MRRGGEGQACTHCPQRATSGLSRQSTLETSGFSVATQEDFIHRCEMRENIQEEKQHNDCVKTSGAQQEATKMQRFILRAGV